MRIKVLSGGRKGIELPLSDAGLNFQMRRIDIEETVPMCRLVEVSEQDNPLHHFEGQTVNMDEVNFFAKRMESLTEYERKVLSAYAEDYGVAKTVVNKVVFPAIDLILAVFFFAKLGTAYFDYRKHGQFEWAAPAILFACLVFTLTAPAYIWTILGM